MQVYAKLFSPENMHMFDGWVLMALTRTGQFGSRQSLSELIAGGVFVRPRDCIDLRDEWLGIGGGRKSILRFLMQEAGQRPLIKGAGPRLGIYRKVRVFKKNKTLVLLYGPGFEPPPIRDVEFQPLVPLLDGVGWTGDRLLPTFTPEQLARALASVWGMNFAEAIGGPNPVD